MSTPPVPDAGNLKAAQRQAWSDSASVTAWRKWFPQFVVHTREATHVMVESARLKPGMQVLDLASGSGEPALTLARLVGPGGHVTATDLVPDMLDIAEENARGFGLTNMTFRQADAEALPFPGESFDVVTCRFGIIYCPDAGQALREIRRVLKPGGRVALIAWGPPAQPFFATTVGVFAKYVQIPPAAPGTPLPFQFAQPGSLSAVMIAARFQQVREDTRTIAWTFPGSVEDCWDYQREITGAAFRRIFAGLAPEKHAQVIGEVLAAIRQYYDGRQVNYTANIVSAVGVC